MWIARNKSGALALYGVKPYRFKDFFSFSFGDSDKIRLRLDDKLFKEVTWKNSPQEVEFKIVNR